MNHRGFGSNVVDLKGKERHSFEKLVGCHDIQASYNPTYSRVCRDIEPGCCDIQ